MKKEKLIAKLNEVASQKPSGWLDKANERYKESDWLLKSAQIAVKVLVELRQQQLSQKDLAELLSVSPQYINKIVKGKENLSLDTICKIERALNIELISIPYFSSSQVIKAVSYSDYYKERISNPKNIGHLTIEYSKETNYHPQEEIAAA
jgi:transcriptional regulator with XRE-family HTH domain